MSISTRTLTVLLYLTSLWGCVYAPPRPLELDESNIKSVAVLSFVPEKANLQRIGLTVFNNEQTQIDLGGRITRTIESVAIKRLNAARPEWSIKQISYDRDVLIARMNGPGLGRAYDGEGLYLDLADLCRTNGVDVLFVVRSLQYDRYRGDGVGVLMHTSSLSSLGHTTVHSHIALHVVGSRGQVVAVSRARPEDPRRLDTKALGIKYELKDNLRSDVISRLSDEMIEQLTKSLNTMFDGLVVCKQGTCTHL